MPPLVLQPKVVAFALTFTPTVHFLSGFGLGGCVHKIVKQPTQHFVSLVTQHVRHGLVDEGCFALRINGPHPFKRGFNNDLVARFAFEQSAFKPLHTRRRAHLLLAWGFRRRHSDKLVTGLTWRGSNASRWRSSVRKVSLRRANPAGCFSKLCSFMYKSRRISI